MPACAADAARRARYAGASMTPVAVSVPGETPADRPPPARRWRSWAAWCCPGRPWGAWLCRGVRRGLRLAAWDEEGTVLRRSGSWPWSASSSWRTAEAAWRSRRGAGGGGGRWPPYAAGRSWPWTGTVRSGGGLCRPSLAADGIFAAVRAVCPSGPDGERLSTLAGRVPNLVVLRREVPFRRSRGEVTVDLAEAAGVQNGEGGASRTGECGVAGAPQPPGCAPGSGGGRHTEDAEALCRVHADRVRELDRQG
ncbi:MAG: hypothetical protein ACLSAF_12030 [Intestinimonas sp.]